MYIYIFFLHFKLNKQNLFSDLALKLCSEYDLFLNINSEHSNTDRP